MKIRGKEIRTKLTYESLSGSSIRKVSLPRFEDDGETLRFLLKENVPGSFPYTAGVFPLRRPEEDPKRMFAGEGPPERTNRRFHLLCDHEPAKRLSTSFDSVTFCPSSTIEIHPRRAIFQRFSARRSRRAKGDRRSFPSAAIENSG